MNVFMSSDQLNAVFPATELAGAAAVSAALVGSDAPLQMSLCGNPQLQNLVNSSSSLQVIILSKLDINSVANLGNSDLGVGIAEP